MVTLLGTPDSQTPLVGVSWPGRYARQHAAWYTAMSVLVTLRSLRGRLGIVPAVATIAAEVDRSERTVQRALRDLVAAGRLIVIPRGGPPRSELWHESRTNEYVIVGETRRERRWRRPGFEADRIVYRLAATLGDSLAPYLLKGQDILKIVRYLMRRAVDKSGFFDPVAEILRCPAPAARRRPHWIESSGYCVHCGERPSAPHVPEEWAA